MSEQSGEQSFAARARLLLLLGEQLITDETAAISELIKNSYDADASQVIVEIENVSVNGKGIISVTDDGNGMTKDTVLNSWMELGTISKARRANEPPRFSETLNRPYLGEKGLGRLAIHKLGQQTELVTRRVSKNQEVVVSVDWARFDNDDNYLNDVKVEWKTRTPTIFVAKSDLGFEKGTSLTVTKLQRVWTHDMIDKVVKYVSTIQSPFSSLENFEIKIKVKDPIYTLPQGEKIVDFFETADYKFVADVHSDGLAHISYQAKTKSEPFIDRKFERDQDLKQSEAFPSKARPRCGPFRIQIYCWELSDKDKKTSFGSIENYQKLVKPQTGVKLFRDGFRVLPYGNEDNDWLGMDQRRIEAFAENVSRNQVIGVVEISSRKNPNLVDKSDREGLIANDAFSDFRGLLKSVLAFFNAERVADRLKIKETKRKEKAAKASRTFSDTVLEINRLLRNENITDKVRSHINSLVVQASSLLNEIVEEAEEPLLVAASLGLSLTVPTHDARIQLRESLKVLKDIRTRSPEALASEIDGVISRIRRVDELIAGVMRLSSRVVEGKSFEVAEVVNDALTLMKYRLDRNEIEPTKDFRKAFSIVGNQKLIDVLLINLLDNSIYWLGTESPENRRLKIITDCSANSNVLIVSDSGPGFSDDIDTITLPFFTRKPNGTGLGLYICERIARMHGAKLMIPNPDEFSGLLSGANICVVFPRGRSK